MMLQLEQWGENISDEIITAEFLTEAGNDFGFNWIPLKFGFFWDIL